MRQIVVFLVPIFAISFLSWTALYSVGDFSYVGRSVLFALFGTALFIVLTRINQSVFTNRFLVLFANGVLWTALLITVLVGAVSGDRRGWIPLGPFTLQPSELAKVALVLNAVFLVQRKKILYAALLFAMTFLVFIEPDLGSAMLLLGIGIAVLISFLKPRQIAALCVAAMLTVYAGSFLLKDYQKERILTFLDPARDPLGAGYNLKQLRIAIGSGGLLGKGFLGGTHARLGFLPSAQTDFLLAAFLEEWGAAGWAMLVVPYGFLAFVLVRRGARSQNPYARAMLFAGSSIFVLEFAVNAGINLSLLPIVGLPMPFFSYGGSQEIAHFAILGILANISQEEASIS